MWGDPSARYLDPAGIQAHVDHYKNLRAQGKLAAGGPFLDVAGGMMVLSDGVELEEALRIVEDDPAVRSGLLLAEVHSWLTFPDGRAD